MFKVRRRWVWCAAALTLGVAGCARDDVQRMPPNPQVDTVLPEQVEAPPFSPDASANRAYTKAQERAERARPPSRAVVDGVLVKATRDEVVVRDAEGNKYAFRVTPETRTSLPLEEGTSVRAAWVQMHGELVATELRQPQPTVEGPPTLPAAPIPAQPRSR